MQEAVKLLIGTGALALGFLIGSLLAKKTKEELNAGQKWFRIIMAISLAGGIASLVFRNDILMFSFFFIAVVTSRSLKVKINK